MVRRLKCPVEGCTWGENEDTGGVWKTEDDYETLDQAQKAMEMHLEGHRLGNAAPIPAPPAVQGQNQSRIPKSISPKVEMGISTQEWEYFIGDWRLTEGFHGIHQYLRESKIRHSYIGGSWGS